MSMNTPAVVMDNGTGLTKLDLPETILLHLFSQQQLQLPLHHQKQEKDHVDLAWRQREVWKIWTLHW